jgi:signal transduction histidine kinase
MWILYQTRLGVRRVDPASLQRYAAEASMVFTNWQQMRSLSEQRKALQQIARAPSFEAASIQVVKSTFEMFDAKTVTFWPYDGRRQSFKDAHPVSKGFDEPLPAPKRDGTTYRLLDNRTHLVVDDVEKYDGFREHGAETLNFLRRQGVKSVEGVAICTADESLGVLFVGHAHTRPFGLTDVRVLLDWATIVATILQTVQKLETERNVHAAAEQAAGYLAKGGSLRSTLDQLAHAALDLLRCGTVTIHQYDDENDKPIFPPVSAGLRNQQRMEMEDNPDATALIPRLIRGQPETIAPNREAVAALFESRFVHAEDIHATLAIRLEYATRYVGVMFFSFRNKLEEHTTASVLAPARLFARHASVAIGTSQRSDALTRLSAILLAGTSPILMEALKVIRKHLRPNRCNIVFVEGTRLRSVAEIGWGSDHQSYVEPDSHAGFTISKRRPIAFSNIASIQGDALLEGFKPPKRLFDAGIRSGLAVPILRGAAAVGAILVHAEEERDFSAEDISFMTIVANQLMMAHLGAQRVRAIKAESAAASLIAAGDDGESAMFEKLLQVLTSHVTDEKCDSKIENAWITLRGDKIEPNPAGITEAILTRGDPIGRIHVTTRHGLALNEDDREILRNIAALAGIAVGQMRDHRDSTITLTSLAESLGERLKQLSARLDRVQEEFALDRTLEGVAYVAANLERLAGRTRRIAHTVRALDDPARIDRRRQPASAIARLIRTIYEQEQPEAKLVGIDLRFPDIQLGGVEIELDETMIAAVLSNLVENAIEFTPIDGWIECRASENAFGITIEIEDSGRGLTTEELDLVFNRFHHAAVNRVHKGLKIRLGNCHRVMALHGGRIDARSQGRDKGSTFAVFIPWAAHLP